ncbi:hypothetical protein K9L27_00985 [Candidatus Gracilibacteria bacterium]|nr:hypothetical protein [Candidatus Gracilibacteria bacterium]
MKNLSLLSIIEPHSQFLYKNEEIVGKDVLNREVKGSLEEWSQEMRNAEIWTQKAQTGLALEIEKSKGTIREVQRGDTLGAIVKGLMKEQFPGWKKALEMPVDYRSDKGKVDKPTILKETNLIVPGQKIWIENGSIIVADELPTTNTEKKIVSDEEDVEEKKTNTETEEVKNPQEEEVKKEKDDVKKNTEGKDQEDKSDSNTSEIEKNKSEDKNPTLPEKKNDNREEDISPPRKEEKNTSPFVEDTKEKNEWKPLPRTIEGLPITFYEEKELNQVILLNRELVKKFSKKASAIEPDPFFVDSNVFFRVEGINGKVLNTLAITKKELIQKAPSVFKENDLNIERYVEFLNNLGIDNGFLWNKEIKKKN